MVRTWCLSRAASQASVPGRIGLPERDAACYTRGIMVFAGPHDVDTALLDLPTHLDETCRQAWSVRTANHESEMLLVRPTATTAISVTGKACALYCAHCGGHYLEHMQPIWDANAQASKSCLISGGCDSRGIVPLADHADDIRHLAGTHRLNLHVGLIEPDALAELALPIDVISFDIVGDPATTRLVYGLDVTLETYIDHYLGLCRIAPVVPHITIGLNAGQVVGEYAAIDALVPYRPERLVFIVLIPTAGTRFAACSPPGLDQTAEVLAYARCALPHTRIILGCMRPHGRYRQRLDELAVLAGVNAIVNPTLAGERASLAAGLSITMGDECCALY